MSKRYISSIREAFDFNSDVIDNEKEEYFLLSEYMRKVFPKYVKSWNINDAGRDDGWIPSNFGVTQLSKISEDHYQIIVDTQGSHSPYLKDGMVLADIFIDGDAFNIKCTSNIVYINTGIGDYELQPGDYNLEYLLQIAIDMLNDQFPFYIQTIQFPENKSRNFTFNNNHNVEWLKTYVNSDHINEFPNVIFEENTVLCNLTLYNLNFADEKSVDLFIKYMAKIFSKKQEVDIRVHQCRVKGVSKHQLWQRNTGDDARLIRKYIKQYVKNLYKRSRRK